MTSVLGFSSLFSLSLKGVGRTKLNSGKESKIESCSLGGGTVSQSTELVCVGSQV